LLKVIKTMKGTDNINFIYQFNNKSRSAGFFLLYILSGVLFLGAIVSFILMNLNFPLVLTVFIAITYFILFHFIKPSYIELLISETDIQVNYYSVATAIKSYQSVVIDRSDFNNYEIRNKYSGLQKQLILTEESKFGLADYPPISVSILSKSELNQVIIVLSKIANNKK
jgi:hypothetical protein